MKKQEMSQKKGAGAVGREGDSDEGDDEEGNSGQRGRSEWRDDEEEGRDSSGDVVRWDTFHQNLTKVSKKVQDMAKKKEKSKIITQEDQAVNVIQKQPGTSQMMPYDVRPINEIISDYA